PGQGQRLPPPLVAVLHRHPAHDLRRLRGLALHQHLRGGSRPRHRRRHPAHGQGVLHQGEPHRRHLPAQGWRFRGRRRSGRGRPARARAGHGAPADRAHKGGDGPGQAPRRPGPDGRGQELGSTGDEAGARPHRQAGARAPGRPGGTEEVKTSRLALTLAVFGMSAAAAAPLTAQTAAIPDNPEKLVFAPIAYTPPVARDYRVVLKNGMVVYIAEDPTLPLVNIELTLRTGSYLVPAGKEGLAGLTGSQIRRGGTKTMTAEQLDEKLDFLAANVGTSIGETSGRASLNTLRDNLDESLKVFVEMLKEPRFQEDRLALAKEQALQEMKKRNDDSEDVEAREWNVLLYGEGHFSNRFTTAASIQSITRADLADFHRKYVHPANMIAAVSGSFSRAAMIQKLEAAFANWPGTAAVVPPVPSEIQTAAPGIYRIQKDVNQGRVSIGLPSVRRDDPDAYALEVMNEILGGSGFTPRITKTVRSDEGLAYSAGSGLRFGVYYPG